MEMHTSMNGKRGFLAGRFTILEEDPALYHRTYLGPVTYMKTIAAKCAKQYLSYCSTLHTAEAIKKVNLCP
jgi:hypothetical protein